MAPVATVVIPAFNAGATIAETLEALRAQDVAGEYEVIVVDGGSSDPTREIALAAGVTVLDNPRRGPVEGRNVGARQATGGALAFTDADCRPDSRWLAAGLRALERAELVQGHVLAASAHGPFDRTIVVNSEYGLYETANMFVRRDLFHRVGGFEPLPGLHLPEGAHFGEDTWFAWRAKRAGASTAFAGDAIVAHAVFTRGVTGYVAEQARCRYFPHLVAAIPELRDAFLYRRWFLSPASSRFDLAAAGLLTATLTRRPWPALAALPYAAATVRATRGRPVPERVAALAAQAAADAITLGALLAGSVRTGTAVL
jgi:glycosyltransferase involved in cell wall biosynthesis